MRVKVILNPYAGQLAASDRTGPVRKALQKAQLDFDLVSLQHRGQAIKEAQRAVVEGYDAVIAAGGDGTVHEVVNGLMAVADEGLACPLGILPLGTGNDFADMAGLPRDLDSAARLLAAGETQPVDAGWVSYSFNDDHQDPLNIWQGCFFNNSCAVAMESVVTQEVNKLTQLSGNVRYVAAVLRSLTRMQAWDMHVSWDGGRYSGPIYLLSVAITPRTGGLFLIAPNAKLADGLFDIVIAPKCPWRRVAAILPGLLNGSHIEQPEIITARTSQLHIISAPGTPIHTDGEIISSGAHQIHFQILPGKIRLLGGQTSEQLSPESARIESPPASR